MSNSRHSQRSSLSPEQYQRLKSEMNHPYRGLRQFLYIAFAGSGFIGAVFFLAQLASGQEVSSAFPNFALQVGVVALMILLFRWDRLKPPSSS